MQKKLIALAIAGLVAAPAFAQSNVTVYGRIDYGFQSRTGNSGGVNGVNGTSGFDAGLESGSRIGFKGAEDLGNGMKAIFEMEFGSLHNDSDDKSQLNGSRHAYVGLTGNFGTVVGGRLDGVRYGIFNKYDPFAGGGMGNFTQMTGQVDRADNTVAYISPSFNGLTATLAYGTAVANVAQTPGAIAGTSFFPLVNVTGGAQENNGNRGDLRLNTVMLAYDNGPLSVNLDAERVYGHSNGAVQNSGLGFAFRQIEERVYVIGAAYDFGVVKVSALYDINKTELDNSDISDVRSWFVGAKAPVAQNIVLKAVYGRTKERKLSGDPTASKWGVGADYLLSKRTNLYVDYGSIHNDNDTAFQISAAANSDGSGLGTRGFDIGIAHKF